MDNSSQPGGFAKAKKAVEYLNVEEIVTAFISFGGLATQEAKDLGFKNILDEQFCIRTQKSFQLLIKISD